MSIQLRDDVHALVDADGTAVQRHVVVLGMTPVGVETVVDGAVLVLIPQTLLLDTAHGVLVQPASAL